MHTDQAQHQSKQDLYEESSVKISSFLLGMAKNYSIDDLTKKTAKLGLKERDKDYYGLQGLDPHTLLYRACAKDENIKKDIVCKDPDSDRTVEQHIASGSRKPSRFISTTLSSDVVKKWAEKDQTIIQIYLSRLDGMNTLDEIINLTDKDVREHFIKGAMHRNYAKSSEEVLFQFRIPKKNSRGQTVFEKSNM